MPIIAPHLKHHSFIPVQGWADDCSVQWGGSGIVIGGDEVRRTAFFEAFPANGGFFRGEGEAIVDAEAACFAKVQKFETCPGHEWSRRNYTNGGAFCRHCGSFRVALKPIVKLGNWRAPLNAYELEAIAEGGLFAWEDRNGKHYPPRERTRLRAKLFGVHLPPIPKEPVDLLEAENHPYTKECRDILFGWAQDHGGYEALVGLTVDQSKNIKTMDGLFSSLSIGMVKHIWQDWIEENNSEEATPDGP